MQFFITILSLAVAVAAVPQGNGNTVCKGGNEKAVCCGNKDALVGALQCITLPISVQQPGCDGSIRCCDIGDQKEGVVNVNLANCASVA